MNINWKALSEFEKVKFEKMNETDRFIYFLGKQYGSPYGWGKENPEKSDCSGAVCMALFAATGLLIRTTADDLLKRVFTKVNPRQGDIRAVFYVTKKDGRHGDRMVAAGTATHVAGILEDSIILNSQEPFAKIRRITDVSDWYQRNGHEVVIRGLDREALARLAKEGKTVYDLDDNFWQYFEK
ncbi:MAG: C40 family peptidase [Treponema sp.]|jgi:murein DD-endopeptidase|nr:C40 family peptidase [Treponema sp.]